MISFWVVWISRKRATARLLFFLLLFFCWATPHPDIHRGAPLSGSETAVDFAAVFSPVRGSTRVAREGVVTEHRRLTKVGLFLLLGFFYYGGSQIRKFYVILFPIFRPLKNGCSIHKFIWKLRILKMRFC